MNKLSMIVPVYNDEKNIENSINSLLKQTIKVDIIVVDDGSTDNTSNILKQLKKKHNNIYYYKKKNSGIADARNYGVNKVKTKYFGFLDSDDTCKNDMAEKMLNEIEKTKSDICFSNFTWVYPNGKTKLSIDTMYKNKKEIFVKMYATLWNKIYKTSWFKNTKVKFPSGLVYEDASVLFRLVPYMDRVCFINESFVNYYQTNGSITHTFNTYINDMIHVFDDIINYYKNNKLYNEYKNELEYVTCRFFLGNSYLRSCRINDREDRNSCLKNGWNFLIESFPSFKSNYYLSFPGMRHKYFRTISQRRYYSNVNIFRFLYKLKIMK